MTDDPRERFADALERLLARYDGRMTPQHHGIDAPVDSVHAIEGGSGDPLVCLHGVGATASMYVPLLASLADTRTVYAPDRPGRGLSDPYVHRRGELRHFNRAFLDAYLDEIGHDTVSFVGSSFGGFQALAYAIDRPGRVDRLVLVGAPGGLTRDLPIPYRLLGVRLVNRLMFRLLRKDSIEEAHDAMEPILVTDASAVASELVECMLYASWMPEHQRSLRSLFETSAGLRGNRPEMVIREEVTGVDRPTTFLWGSEDYFYAPAVGRPVAEAMPDATFEVLDGLGHVPWLEPHHDVDERIATALEPDGNL